MAPESDGEERTFGSNETSPPSTLSAGPAIPPLSVTGLVVTKTDLVRALRIYVPQLIDVVEIDGESFMLKLTAANPENNGRL